MKCSLLTLSCALDGELSKERQVELETHLVTCERCRTGMQYLREETERISQLAKVHIPPATATALLERARVVAPESGVGSVAVAASASEAQIMEVPPAAEPAAEAGQRPTPAIPDPALWSTTAALPSFEGPTLGEAMVEEEDQPLEEGEDPTSEPTLSVAGAAEPVPPVAASPDGAAALEAEIEAHDAPDGSDQPPAELGSPEEIFPMGHAEAPEPDTDPAGGVPEFVDLAPSLPATQELGSADGYPSVGDPADSSNEDLWSFPAGAAVDAPEEMDQEGESDPGDPANSSTEDPWSLSAGAVTDPLEELGQEGESDPGDPAGDQATPQQSAPSVPDNPWTAAEAEPPSISPLGPWQRGPDAQRQLPAWVPLAATDGRPLREAQVPEAVPEPIEAGDRDELMQVALEESASLREDNPGGAAAGEPTKAPPPVWIPPPPSLPSHVAGGWEPRADLLDIPAVMPTPEPPVELPPDPLSTPMDSRHLPSETATPRRPAETVAPRRPGGPAAPGYQRIPPPHRPERGAPGPKPAQPSSPRSWTKTATIAIAALAVFLIGWSLTHHSSAPPAPAKTGLTTPAPTGGHSPAASPKPTGTPASALTLTGTQTFGGSGSGYQVQGARYGLHQNGTQLWVVFQLVQGSGPPKIVTGFDGPTTVYVEMSGVAAGTAVAQPVSGQLVTSVEPGSVPGFSGAVYVIKLSRAAQVSGSLLAGSETGSSGERVVLQFQ